MARLHFDGLGAHSLGHEAFEIGIDRPVFRGNGIETWLRPPGRMRGLAREQSLLERLLDRIENLRLRFRQVAREIAQERGLVETPFIAVEDDPGDRKSTRLNSSHLVISYAVFCLKKKKKKEKKKNTEQKKKKEKKK